jgi:hypothetical protein
MGLNDAAEMLEAAQLECVRLERELAAERTRADGLEGWKEQALPVISGLQELGRALGIRLGRSITGPEAAEVAHALVAERDALRGERDAALAKLAMARRTVQYYALGRVRLSILAVIDEPDTAALERRDRAVAEQALRGFAARVVDEIRATDEADGSTDWASEEYRHGMRSILDQIKREADDLSTRPTPKRDGLVRDGDGAVLGIDAAPFVEEFGVEPLTPAGINRARDENDADRGHEERGEP